MKNQASYIQVFNAVKTAMRWGHTDLDTELQDTISAAQEELIRVGVDKRMAYSDHPLVLHAVKTYCKGAFADDQTKRDGFMQSFEIQADGMRKSEMFGPAGAVAYFDGGE